MLVVLGLLAATGLFYARAAGQQADEARTQSNLLKTQNHKLQNDLDHLIAVQAQMLDLQARSAMLASRHDAQASTERAVLTRRIAALEAFIVQLLARSRDPAVAGSAQAYTNSPSPQPSPTSRKPHPRPSPQPSPTPSCHVQVGPICIP
jgi:hypothetical protein